MQTNKHNSNGEMAAIAKTQHALTEHTDICLKSTHVQGEPLHIELHRLPL